MELQLARQSLKDDAKKMPKLPLEDIVKKHEHGECVFYFSGSNPHKDMLAMLASLEKKGYRVCLFEVKISTDAKDFLYALHFI
ncbi:MULTISPECIES: HP0268 family nuclease [Helicobacter]|uniref:HP0268 family nuclease n=1 Tax=Helicobacter TaxID=209 RepID=UPI000CEEF29C|nr:MULTISPECIES: HP0268 family nuclease [Helicobacter]